jgi:hypothetical protein
MSCKYDHTGQVFTWLTVLRKSKLRQDPNKIMWDCLCKCGKKLAVRGENLRSGKSKSCGCYRSHLSRNRPPPNRQALGEAARRRYHARTRDEALRYGRVWELTEDQFFELTSSNCEYCGIEPGQEYSTKSVFGAYVHNGIDRVDNDVGYIYENCVPCCKRCNYTKGRQEVTAWLEQCSRVAEHQKNKLLSAK